METCGISVAMGIHDHGNKWLIHLLNNTANAVENAEVRTFTRYQIVVPSPVSSHDLLLESLDQIVITVMAEKMFDGAKEQLEYAVEIVQKRTTLSAISSDRELP